MEVVDNQSIDDADNNIEDTQFFLLFMPYILLTQTDGGPDYNIMFIWRWLAAVALFILRNMD